jgi:hypothetical protein
MRLAAWRNAMTGTSQPMTPVWQSMQVIGDAVALQWHGLAAGCDLIAQRCNGLTIGRHPLPAGCVAHYHGAG